MANIEKIINLGRDEIIELLIRRSPWAWFWQIVLACILIVGPFFAMFPLFSLGLWGIILFLILIFIGLLIGLRVYVAQKNTVFVMTNYRIADIDQKGFINRTAVEIPYNKIKNIEYSRSSIIDFILGLGDIYILLTDNKSKIKLSKIKSFRQAADEIFLCQKEYFDHNVKLANN